MSLACIVCEIFNAYWNAVCNEPIRAKASALLSLVLDNSRARPLEALLKAPAICPSVGRVFTACAVVLSQSTLGTTLAVVRGMVCGNASITFCPAGCWGGVRTYLTCISFSLDDADDIPKLSIAKVGAYSSRLMHRPLHAAARRVFAFARLFENPDEAFNLVRFLQMKPSKGIPYLN